MATTIGFHDLEVRGRHFVEMRLSSDNGVNPLSKDTVGTIRGTMDRLAAPGAAHGLLISAEGKSFCAGADVKEFRTFDEDSFRRYMSDILAMYADMIEFPKPIVCVVHADALGGGAALAFFSDLVVAADHAKFGLPEVHRGLAGGGYLMPRLVGKHRAAEMVLLGRSFSAAEMQNWGLINAVCPAVDLRARTTALCEELAALEEGAFAVAKTSLAGGLAVDLRSAMDRHVAAQTQAFLKVRAAAQSRPAAAPAS